MDQLKRKLNFNQSNKQKAKKLRDGHHQSITCIENLSNEIFYEIFDYLNGYQINQSFVNLNHRFQQLLESPSLLFKFKINLRLNGLHMNIYERMINLNQHQILSINLSMVNKDIEIITASAINSSFTRLESLTLNNFEPDVLLPLLSNLASLPRLFSLLIMQWRKLEKLSDCYVFILNLPKLRYLKFFVNEDQDSHVTVSLPLPPSQSVSTIEYLVIDHPCNSQDLSNIISYTPHLSRLSVTRALNIKENFPIIFPLSNLTNLSIDLSSMSFDEFEILISKIDAKLKILRLYILFDNRVYLNARRWEQLILQYLPGLEKFYLKYFDFIIEYLETERYSEIRNEFFSSFWLERQWILEAETDDEVTIYSIRPYKEKWYDYRLNATAYSSDQLLKSMHLDILNTFSSQNLDYLCENIDYIINVAQIYHLTIRGEIFAGVLARILMPLSTLDSLKIPSLSISQPRSLSNEERSILHTISSTIRITKVNLQKMNHIEEIYFLLELCPNLIYLKVDCVRNMDMKLFVRLILKKLMTKYLHQLRLLCFHVRAADDQTVKQLNKMIHDEKLLIDYEIKRVLNNIYLQWNRKE